MHHLRLRTYTLVFGLLFGLADTVHAHDPGLSTADLRITESQIAVHFTFARRDIESLIPIDADRNGSVTAAEFDAARPHLQILASGMTKINVDNQRVAAQVTTIELDQSDALHFHLNSSWKACSRLSVSMPIISELARSHRQYVSVRNEEKNLVTERILTADNPAFEVAITNTVTTAKNSLSFRQFLILGIEHIMKGYDHLLFLFGLLVIGGNFWSVGRIITSFTVAHSITLALATFSVVQLPPGIVEPLIAASITYIGMENLFCRNLHRRWLLTFGFGLVHGLGFASVLRELSIGAKGDGMVIPLLAFNLGVEIGQIAIALLVLPLIWKSQQLPNFFPRLATACSVLMVLVGTYWLCERI